ncbi:MAG: response regulator [Deltaproteobacteria bacterium CG_4_8_14_3_um_filter_51_11]|nr:response regulator [bacterium]OIP40831.1 MAG: hypothetical protein AUK25_06980 [Desulfobacteraceae bacterium CG2_30_51_40]PIP47463.1 MAG: response regulator [Deltaproteobacteria bacterium CG23_combo_of_CG06-09_8_20_14_all_51_20]PIW00134.1 MAG: response regulator [Deltaproteobacteria bacterium CG17_big_fil_post_rev_8_21_14_2_50_51_6]PIX18861.1 MAG: response regulator [Deltaproteobacteria bacterium CG_4_8_14_3_um_filter_51_11]PIY25733.1 MAG: response regulator [Deltaproteobacteria bacterium C
MGEKGRKILVIDDDPDFVKSTGMVLRSGGYEVVEAFSGKEGLEKSRAEKPDLYIIDLMMETYSEGSNVVKALIEDEETKTKPRIMITSVDLQGPWDSYPEDDWMPCDFVLQKPVLPNELLGYVKDALSKK